MTEPPSSISDPSQFDFNAYLTKLDPEQAYTIDRLQGGLVNITVRATKCLSKSKDLGRFEGHKSVILKYAPPYVATVGEEGAPLLTYRQVIEARALKLLEARPSMRAVQASTRTSIPCLLHEDHVEHVLILSDLGEHLVDIDKWLARKPPPRKDVCEQVGERLGVLLAAINGLSLWDLREFENPDMGDMIAREVVGRVGDMLGQVGISDDQRTVICEAVEREYEEDVRSKGRGQGVFSVGDLWTGSILLSEDAERVCVIDWEFAGEGRPLQDMAQLAAHLHLQAMVDPSGTVSTFAAALHRSYYGQTKALSPQWIQRPMRSIIIRSAWILHGREMIYNAVERSFHVVEGETSAEATARQGRMVEIGMWYIRRAVKRVGSAELQEEVFLRELYANQQYL